MTIIFKILIFLFSVFESPVFLVTSYLFSLSFLSASMIAIYRQKTDWQSYLDGMLTNKIMYYLMLTCLAAWHLILSLQGVLLDMTIGLAIYAASFAIGFMILWLIERWISKAYLHIFLWSLPFSTLLASMTFCSLAVIV